jgi:hypothetical protein
MPQDDKVANEADLMNPLLSMGGIFSVSGNYAKIKA